MAEAVQGEVMYQKEGNRGMTSLTFRSKQYAFPSMVMKPESHTSQTQTEGPPDPVCVLLDVGLVCPHCTGSFTAKFVRRQARLALSQQGNFDSHQGPGQLMLTADGPERGGETPSQDSDNDSDLGLRSNVIRQLGESGIHVHITPQSAGEQQPKFAKIVPLSQNQPRQGHPQHQHHHQHHHVHHQPAHHQSQPSRHRDQKHAERYHLSPEQERLIKERQLLMRQNQIKQNKERQLLIKLQQQREMQKRMPPVGSVYVEEKSAQYVIKHDLSKKHSHRRAPPPPPPKKKKVPTATLR